MRTLKHLEPFVTLTNTFQEPGGQGWSFGEAGPHRPRDRLPRAVGS